MNSSLTIETFTAHREFLFSIAYRMLGSLSEAEDMVQEVWLRWQRQDAAGIQSAKAWLRSAMRRLCIDQLRSARHQREDLYGVSVPEPSLPTTDAKPDISVEKENSLTMAFTLMQERLKPTERVVFLLREVFDYDYADTAAMAGKAEANCRQIVRRAKAQLLANSAPPPQPNEQVRDLVEQFVSAATTGEVKNFLALVKEESPLPGDGGDQAKAKRRRNRRAHIVCGSRRTVISTVLAPRISCTFASQSPEGDSVPLTFNAS
ncbi:MAG TPA: sigma-70 family RNA polymerase sigma factor [Verrucomicrobiae bacterium]|nr:sigma-70 family RNA polymerase sigma factor [Verrucomicrobiae bacterium]